MGDMIEEDERYNYRKIRDNMKVKYMRKAEKN
jgi:hypothetical protein